MGKKPIASVTYENERISIKNSLSYIKCVLRLSWVLYGRIYGLFMGCTVNDFLSTGWGFQRSGPTDPSKENGRKFAPTAPVAPVACYLDGIWRRLEPLERIYGRFPSVDPSGRFAGFPNLGKPLYREKTVYSTTH